MGHLQQRVREAIYVKSNKRDKPSYKDPFKILEYINELCVTMYKLNTAKFKKIDSNDELPDP